MKFLHFELAFLAVLASTNPIFAAHLDPTSDLNALGNNTLFNRWRPQFHVLAPAGWMNDPCGAMYDPTTKTYHIMYQWHPTMLAGVIFHGVMQFQRISSPGLTSTVGRTVTLRAWSQARITLRIILVSSPVPLNPSIFTGSKMVT